jgi:hypothetical protein
MALSFIGGGNQSNQSAGVLIIRLFHVGLFHTVAPLCNSLRCIHGNVLLMDELPEGKMCFCRSNALIPCSFCDSKINIYGSIWTEASEVHIIFFW